MRRTVKPPKLTRVLFPTGPGYRMMIGQGLQGSKWLPGAKKNADWTFQLGKEFRAKYWDGREHLVLGKNRLKNNFNFTDSFYL